MYRLIIYILLIGSITALNAAKRPKDSMWGKCISETSIVPCKVIEDSVKINGKTYEPSIIQGVALVNGELNLLVRIKDEKKH